MRQNEILLSMFKARGERNRKLLALIHNLVRQQVKETGETALSSVQEPVQQGPLRDGGRGGRFVKSPCAGEKRCLAQATSRKGVSSTEMLILWLPNAIFRSDIYISIDQQLPLDTVSSAFVVTVKMPAFVSPCLLFLAVGGQQNEEASIIWQVKLAECD